MLEISHVAELSTKRGKIEKYESDEIIAHDFSHFKASINHGESCSRASMCVCLFICIVNNHCLSQTSEHFRFWKSYAMLSDSINKYFIFDMLRLDESQSIRSVKSIFSSKKGKFHPQIRWVSITKVSTQKKKPLGEKKENK